MNTKLAVSEQSLENAFTAVTWHTTSRRKTLSLSSAEIAESILIADRKWKFLDRETRKKFKMLRQGSIEHNSNSTIRRCHKHTLFIDARKTGKFIDHSNYNG